MGNSRYALVLTLLVASLLSALPALAATESYSDVTLYNWQKGHFPEVYDLTRGDIVVSYTIDMSSLGAPGWTVAEFGLRSVGAPDLDPTHEGGWLFSRYNSAANNDAVAELNDYHVLMKHGWLEEYYDATGPDTIVPPMSPGAYINYAFHFDRDGVDPYQATFWNYKDGVT